MLLRRMMWLIVWMITLLVGVDGGVTLLVGVHGGIALLVGVHGGIILLVGVRFLLLAQVGLCKRYYFFFVSLSERWAD